MGSDGRGYEPAKRNRNRGPQESASRWCASGSLRKSLAELQAGGGCQGV